MSLISLHLNVSLIHSLSCFIVNFHWRISSLSSLWFNGNCCIIFFFGCVCIRITIICCCQHHIALSIFPHLAGVFDEADTHKHPVVQLLSWDRSILCHLTMGYIECCFQIFLNHLRFYQISFQCWIICFYLLHQVIVDVIFHCTPVIKSSTSCFINIKQGKSSSENVMNNLWWLLLTLEFSNPC